MPRTSPFAIVLKADEKRALEERARKYTSPYFSVVRAKMILLAAQGLGNDEIAVRLDVGRDVVSQWRKRFFVHRLVGLEEQPRSGRPRVFPPRGRRAR
jgi:Winged helix-turn helix